MTVTDPLEGTTSPEGTAIFDDQEAVEQKPSRVLPVLASLIVLGLLLGGAAAALATGGTHVWEAIAGANQGGEPRGQIASTAEVAAAAGVELPEGAAVEPARDPAATVIGQVRVPVGASVDLEAAGFELQPEAPLDQWALWGDSLGELSYWLAADGRSALVGEDDGATVIVFAQR